MPVALIDAARVYANLSIEGLSWLSHTSERELDFLRYVHSKGELTSHRETALNVTKAFAEIGLVAVVHDIDGPGIAWKSQAHQNSWHRILRMDGASPDGLEWVSSIHPDKAPPFRKGWGSLGAPLHTWIYYSSSGEILRAVLRFRDKPDGSKNIRPLTAWRVRAGNLRWEMEAEPNGIKRPLYGLDRLAARPSAPVLIVEGEKAADAAQDRFPDFVVMTWPGGSNAVGKADWPALDGCDVVVWPDADDAGAKAANAVRRALNDLAASCAVVALPQGLPKGWDLADDWPNGLDLVTAERLIREAWAAADNQPPPAPDIVYPSCFSFDPASGWWFQPSGGRGDEPPPALRLCDPFEVVAEARDTEGQGWSLVIAFNDRDGKRHRELVGRGELAGEGIEVRRRLLDAGLHIASTKAGKDNFIFLLSSIRTTARARLTASCGWHNARYVLPHVTIGGDAADTVIWKGRTGATYHAKAGTYEAWRNQVAAPMVGNAVGLVALSCAFAGPLMAKVRAEGGGFHLRGGSSSGKTTALIVAGSACGGGGPRGFAQTWRNTGNALESVALAHSDGLLCLDEIREISPDEAGLAAYALAAGATKGRLRAEGDLRARPSWLVMILSSGEVGLSDLARLTRTKERTYAGQELRLLDIDADQGRGLGCWHKLHDAPSAAAFSETVKGAALENYGHALPLFVERLLLDEVRLIERFRQFEAEFLRDVLRDGDHGQIRRGAQRFAVVAAAGELASELDVAPWPAGEAHLGAVTLFKRWAEKFGRTAAREDADVIRVVRRYLEEYENLAFWKLKPDLSEEDALEAQAKAEDDPAGSRAGEGRSNRQAGWKGVREGDGLVFYFGKEFFAELLSGYDVRHSARVLRDAGYLLTDTSPGRLTRKQRIPGGQMRDFYAVKASILSSQYDD
eukprot:gene16102-16278_t